MGKVKVQDATLFMLLKNFFLVYLPCMRNASKHTIRSYQETWSQFLAYLAEQNHVSLSAVRFDMIHFTSVNHYMSYLASEKDVSDSTWNSRLAGIRAFMNYAAACRPEYINLAGELSTVKCRSMDRFAHIDYMSENAVQAILQAPDVKTKIGLRDQFAMILLYDTSARIQEVLSIRLCDLKLGNSPVVLLHGKGGKIRQVPIMAETVQHFKNYVKVFHQNACLDSTNPLFYTKRSGERAPACADTLRKRIQKYAEIARKTCSEVPERVHPHLFRHSRAMHLYQHGMDLSLISQLLGHSNTETTLIYAYADTEAKRYAIEQAMKDTPGFGGNAEKYTVTDKGLLQLLYAL